MSSMKREPKECRVCLTECQNYFPLTYQIGEGTLVDILNQIGGNEVQVGINDGLAQQVCDSCLDTVLEAVGIATEELDESE